MKLKIFSVALLTLLLSSVNLSNVNATTLAPTPVECNVSCVLSYQPGGVSIFTVCYTCTTVIFMRPKGGAGCCDDGSDNSGPGPIL